MSVTPAPAPATPPATPKPAANATTRFSDRVADYVKYRPHYPVEIIDLLAAKCELAPESVIGDIGAGTGILAKIFLENGNAVVGTLQNFGSAAEGPVAFHLGPDNLLYYTAINTGRLYRIDPPPLAMSFYTVTPCRIADTRLPAGPYGGPALSGLASRSFVIANQCGVPASARSVSVNITVTQPTADGHLTAFPAGAFPPQTSVINFRAGQTRANNTTLALGPAGDATIFCGIPSQSGTVHVILDVNGYYQ